MLPGYLANFNVNNLMEYVVICDSKKLSDRQRKLFLNRLGGWSIEGHFDYSIARSAWKTPFYFVDNHNSAECIELISRLNCAFLLNAGTPRKLCSSILNSTLHGVLNVHPGLLPNYRGKNCPEWAVYHDERVFVTAHIMDVEYDEGDVLGAVEVNWRILPTYIEFRKQVYLKSFELAASVALALSTDRHKILYNSKDSGLFCGVHEAMDDETLEIVKGRFTAYSL